jgi:magnesium transporter
MTAPGVSRRSPPLAAENRLAQAYLAAHPVEAARAIERHAAADGAAVLRELVPAGAGAVLAATEAAHGAAVLLAGGADAGARIVSAMPVDAAARLLRRIDLDARRPLLARCEPGAARTLARVLEHPADTAAGLMDARGVAVVEDLTVGEALARARRARRWLGTYVYVVDDRHALVGVVSLRELLTAAPRAALAGVMTRSVERLRGRADRAAIVAHPGWRRYHELPVVDDRDVFLGVLRYATVRRLEDELAPDHPPAGSLAPLVAIGELYWVGMARILGSLLAALGAHGSPGGRRQ